MPSAALRVKWADALQLDPSRAHNRLCLINDYRGVPDAPDGNVAWVEIEDRSTYNSASRQLKHPVQGGDSQECRVDRPSAVHYCSKF